MASTESKRESVFPKLVEGRDKPACLQFGDVTLDFQRHGLYRDGNRIHLTPKPLATLAFLVEHRGQTVEKQKLLDAVWKDAFVTEDTLVKAIREIRRVLEDDKDNPLFIQTVPGEGYRFIAKVTETRPGIEDPSVSKRPIEVGAAVGAALSERVADAASSEAATAETVEVAGAARRKDRIRFSILVAVGVLLVGLIGGILQWQPWQKTAQPIQRLISTFPGAHTAASFSPDGSMVAFAQSDDTGSNIWVKNLAEGDPIQIVAGGDRPRWSPRNDQIIFMRPPERRGWSAIWSVPPLGGPARLLIGGGQQPDGSSHPEGGRTPSFSWDGSRIVFVRAGEIWTANADGSEERKIFSAQPDSRTPTFSPDGSLIAYVHSAGDIPIGDIWVVPSQGGKPRQLTFDNDLCATPVWTPDGRHLIFSSCRRGSQTLWKVPAAGGEPQPVLVSAGEDTDPEVSRDGTKLIYTTRRNLYTLTLLDPATQQKRELREARTNIMAPVFSPAGDKIAFFSLVGDGERHLFIIDGDGRNPTQVTKGKGEWNLFPRWSRDGSALYFYQERPVPSLRKTSIQGGPSVELAHGWTFSSHGLAHVDPQEKLIAYSQRENGFVAGTFLREIATGRDTLFKKQLYEPQWSDDGQRIVAAEVNSGTRGDAFGDILICSVETAECRKLATRGNRPVFSHDGSRIYFHRFKGADRDLYSVSIDGADEKLVAELKPLPPYNNFTDVSPKGEIAYCQFKPGKPELWMTELK